MKMSIEEKFNEEVAWVLRGIRYRYLMTGKNKSVSFEIAQDSVMSFVPSSSIKEIINKLKEWKAINIKDSYESNGQTFFELKIIEPKFNKIYIKYCGEENKLICGRLKFDVKTGDASYGKIKTRFAPDGKEHTFLRALMEQPDQRLSYPYLYVLLGKTGQMKSDGRNLGYIVRDIKEKLGIGKKYGGNKNLFIGNRGYRIVCKE